MSSKFIQHIFVLQDQPQSMTDQGVPCHLLWLAKNQQVTPEKDLAFSPQDQPKSFKINQIPDYLKIIWLAKNKLVIPENYALHK